MAAISKSYGIGDTVYVHYSHPHPLGFVPQTRVVKSVNINSGTNEAQVSFVAGDPVTDGAVVTVYLTAALCAAAIITDVIAKCAATVLVDATLSAASTIGQPTVALGRKSA